MLVGSKVYHIVALNFTYCELGVTTNIVIKRGWPKEERVDNLELEGVTGGDYPNYVDLDYKKIGREVEGT